jgi:hypothetical protein
MTTADSVTTEYETPGPARIEVDLAFGAIQLVASERSTTTVTVRPAATGRRADTELAAGTRIDFVGGVVSVAVPHRRLSSLLRPGAIEVTIEAPSGSSVRADIGYAPFIAAGSLGRCQIRSSYGDVRLGEVDEAEIKTSGGQVSLGVVHEAASISNSYGNIRVGDAHGSCNLRNSAGDILVGTSRDLLKLKSAYGQINVEHALSGSLDVVTSYGATDVGVADGTAVRLDVETKNGRVLNALTPSEPPREPAPVLQMRVRSGWGDITIRRAARQEGESR